MRHCNQTSLFLQIQVNFQTFWPKIAILEIFVLQLRCIVRLSDLKLEFQKPSCLQIEVNLQIFWLIDGIPEIFIFGDWNARSDFLICCCNSRNFILQVEVHLQTFLLEIRIPKIFIFADWRACSVFITSNWNSRNLHFCRLTCIFRLSDLKLEF